MLSGLAAWESEISPIQGVVSPNELYSSQRWTGLKNGLRGSKNSTQFRANYKIYMIYWPNFSSGLGGDISRATLARPPPIPVSLLFNWFASDQGTLHIYSWDIFPSKRTLCGCITKTTYTTLNMMHMRSVSCWPWFWRAVVR